MREIKFRGMSNEGKWVYGIYVDGFIVNGVVEATDEYIIIENWCPVDADTVGQYTGFKDMNGKEVYEGDIIEYKTIYEWDKSPIKRAEVVFENGMFSPAGVIVDLSRGKIIGNIYENSELLKGGKINGVFRKKKD